MNTTLRNVLIAIFLGGFTGMGLQLFAADSIPTIMPYLSLINDLFLSAIKMIMVPLVVAGLIYGIAGMDKSKLGAIGGKTFGWFIAMSFMSLAAAVFVFLAIDIGTGVPPPIGNAAEAAEIAATTGSTGLIPFLKSLVPSSFFAAASTNNMIQLIVFSGLFGVALSNIGKAGEKVTEFIGQVSKVTFEMIQILMKVVPLAVFSAIAMMAASTGIDTITAMAKFVGLFNVALFGVAIAITAIASFWLKGRTLPIAKSLLPGALFSTSVCSSAASVPQQMAALKDNGVDESKTALVVPMGLSFNMDGSAFYIGALAVFTAQIYGVSLGLIEIVTLLGVSMLATKGIAGVPKAGLVGVMTVLLAIGVPAEGIIIAVMLDALIDPLVSGVNSYGNALAAAVIDEQTK